MVLEWFNSGRDKGSGGFFCQEIYSSDLNQADSVHVYQNIPISCLDLTDVKLFWPQDTNLCFSSGSRWLFYAKHLYLLRDADILAKTILI